MTVCPFRGHFAPRLFLLHFSVFDRNSNARICMALKVPHSPVSVNVHLIFLFLNKNLPLRQPIRFQILLPFLLLNSLKNMKQPGRANSFRQPTRCHLFRLEFRTIFNILIIESFQVKLKKAQIIFDLGVTSISTSNMNFK